MKLISLEMQNFRQHLSSKIDFADGLTGIIGSNGSGKSTILEAIAWALYGAPAVRGTNDTLRSKASEGGAKVNIALTFMLGSDMYKASRTLDANGKSGTAVLEVNGKPLRSGMSEVTAAVAKLIGMDYQAFFTSFFTGQKQLEFMSQLEGRARAVAISRMLGYERVTKVRDQANEDRKGLQREIDGLEKGLPDPEELKERKKAAQAKLNEASKALTDAEKSHKSYLETVDRMRPLKEASDQKAKRQEELSRRLELDRADVARMQTRTSQLQEELSTFDNMSKELSLLQSDLQKFEQAKEEYRHLAELQKYEGERQQLNGQISALQQDIKKLESREKQLAGVDEKQARATIQLTEAEKLLADTLSKIQTLQSEKSAKLQSNDALIKQLNMQCQEVRTKRGQIVDAGSQGKCPTCERPLAEELPTVLANFDSQIQDIEIRIESIAAENAKYKSDNSEVESLQSTQTAVSTQVEELKKEKSAVDTQIIEQNAIKRDITSRTEQLNTLSTQLSNLPKGFDQARFRELHKMGEDLRPVRDKAIALKSALERSPAVKKELEELSALLNLKSNEVKLAEQSLKELSFSLEDHEKLTREYELASSNLNAALVQLERQRGDVNTASAILKEVEREEESLKSKLEQLSQKKSERLYLQTLAEAFDKLRAELNDRIRPELEAAASDLLDMMTDGRYNVLEINDNYQAMIRDDNELKPVISGGEDDIVNLALRLAISQMIAEKAGQSFSLLVLDEVFGSLDDVRRDNVVALLQNLKNRFEQIILITHIESIYDSVDNCLWVEFDEKTKTSRLVDRLHQAEQPEAGVFV